MQSRSIDYTLFFIVLGLSIFGMIMISSVSVYPSFKVTSLMVALGTATEAYNSFYLVRNIIHVIIGFVIFAFIAKTPYTIFERYAREIFLTVVILLFVVLFLGRDFNGTRGWFIIPHTSISFQPAEFIKLALIIYLAHFLKMKRAVLASFRDGFVPFMALLGVVIFPLVLQPDLGSVLVLAPIAVIMFFVAGGSMRYLMVAFLMFTLFAGGIYALGRHTNTADRGKLSYITDRIDNFLADNQTSIRNRSINFQTEQGLIAIGSGGFWGLGFGKSIQKFGYLPEAQGDFVFSVITEELGFIGVLALVACYIAIAWRGCAIALGSEDPFGRYMAVGMTSWIILQAYLNMSVNLNIMPLTGKTLPFISYGGSSLMSLLIGVGILLNISRNARPESVISLHGWVKRGRMPVSR